MDTKLGKAAQIATILALVPTMASAVISLLLYQGAHTSQSAPATTDGFHILSPQAAFVGIGLGAICVVAASLLNFFASRHAHISTDELEQKLAAQRLEIEKQIPSIMVNGKLVAGPDSREAASIPPRLKIIEAHYGVEGINDPDVTHYLLERLHGSSYAELVGADLFHGFDPVAGKVKRITVRYSFDGREAAVIRPENEWLILPEDMFLRKLLDECQRQRKLTENQHNADLSRAQESYRQCEEERRKEVRKANEMKQRLSQFSSLQLDLMQLARDLRQMLNANPAPVPLDHAGSSEENTTHMVQYKEWSDRVFYHYRDDFSARLQRMQSVIGKDDPSLAMYLARFVSNGYMQASNIEDLITTLWGLVVRNEVPEFEIR